MTARVPKDPSPIKAGFLHGGLSLATLALVFGGAGGLIHLTGNADAGSPRVEIALFNEDGDVSPTLKTRLAGDIADQERMIASLTVPDRASDAVEPSLGVTYGNTPAPTPAAATPQSGGIRINGKLVAPGQSLSEVESQGSVAASVEVTPPPAITAQSATVTDDNTPFARYSRPFENPEGKPTVSIIVGGLGIHWRHTQAAITELPADVTLSFAPGAKNLRSWVRQARADGHEVLIELPMEPFDYGRPRLHPQVLQVAASESLNRQRLDILLNRVRGYAGVINYQGGKFATSNDATNVIFDVLSDKGLAFFEDGSLLNAVFEEVAEEKELTFAQSETVIDARPEGDPIETQLMFLEAQALDNGAALGTAFAYPISIDMIKTWTEQLEQKGILLAPASHYARQNKSQAKPVQSPAKPLQPAP
ncbi:MAG: divergent polysaccharide deacetylase family protein [Pseudomonadota bacterium]